MDVAEARLALKEYREAQGLSKREAARQMGVTHAAIVAWEEGSKIPTDTYRREIERWSKKRIRASAWPPSKREMRERDRMQRKKAEVRKANAN